MPKRKSFSSNESSRVCSMRSEGPNQTSITRFFVKKKQTLTPCSRKRPKATACLSPPTPTIHPRHAARSPPTPKPSYKKSKKQSQQLYLDFGQSSFAKNNFCKVCGMLFVHGVAEDLECHEKLCRDYKEGVPFDSKLNKKSIVEVKPHDDSYSLRQKVAQVKKIVDQEIGFVDDSTDCTTYLYIKEKRIVALLRVERIQSAYKLLQTTPSLERCTEPHRAVLGIHQIWVHNNHRKEGIASQLVDHARQAFLFGYHIPKSEVAFSSPTESGHLFAQRYMEGDVFVYDCTA